MNQVSAIRLEEHDAQEARKAKAFPVIPMADFKPTLVWNEVIQDTLPASSVIVPYGSPGSAKTTIILCMGLHVASNTPLGNKRVRHGVVLWFALESKESIAGRVMGWCRENGHDDEAFPFVLIDVHSLNLRNPEDAERVIATARQEAEKYGLPVLMIVIDTLTLAMGGGDENGPDMSSTIASAKRIASETEAAVTLIHHPGKDSARGPRGHSSLGGNIDCSFEVKRAEGSRFVEMRNTKQRNLKDGEVLTFELSFPQIGVNEYGEPITTIVAQPQADTEGAPARKRRPTGQAGVVYEALIEALNYENREPPATPHIPHGVRVTSHSLWKEYAINRLPTDTMRESRERVFRLHSVNLVTKGYAGKWDQDVWLIQ